MIDFKGNWDDHLPLIEFFYIKIYHESIGMAPFEALYGIKCRSSIRWFDVREFAFHGPEFVFEAMEKVLVIRERLKMTFSQQRSYDYNRKRDLEFEVGDWVY